MTIETVVLLTLPVFVLAPQSILNIQLTTRIGLKCYAIKEAKRSAKNQNEEVGSKNEVAIFMVSRKGKPILQYKGHRYRQSYKSKTGTRWICSKKKTCPALLYINGDSEIIMAHEDHNHSKVETFEEIDTNQEDTAIVITSIKGKEMLLFRQYTYRKQYDKGGRARWVCSTLSYCRASVLTDSSNTITSIHEKHCHSPPKFYLKPENVLKAMSK